jgi:hypothetical protein
MEVILLETFVPTADHATIAATLIKPAMSAYSIAVAPD